MRTLLLLVSMLTLAACMPSGSVSVGEERPRIAVVGAAADHLLYVDGLAMGRARDYNGDPDVLLVERGRHTIEIRTPTGTVVWREEMFLAGVETRRISLGDSGGS